MTLLQAFIIYVFFLILEAIFPRKRGVFWSRQLPRDVLFVAVNAYIFWQFWPTLDGLVQQYVSLLQLSLWSLPLPLQWLIVMVTLDFFRWLTHRSFHTFPLLWRMHRTHHRIKELHFLRVLVYNPLENICYAVTTLPPLLLLAFNPAVWPALFLFDAVLGFWNHANVRIRVPVWLAKIVNTPQVHIWHHDESNPKRSRKNFGINLTLWDWIFGTLYLNQKDPNRIGVL